MSKIKSLAAIVGIVKPAHLPKLTLYLVSAALRRRMGIGFLKSVNVRFGGIGLNLLTDFPSGLSFVREILCDDEYGAFPCSAFDGESVLFDVGANVGLVTFLMCGKSPDVRVRAFEPHPRTFGLLRRNIDLNELSSRIIPENVALSDHVGFITMQASSSQNMAVAVAGGSPTEGEFQEIPSMTLDSYCEKNGVWPTHLKIDVEGHEAEVLKGAGKVLTRAREIIIETHSEELKAFCSDVLRGNNFTLLESSHLLHGLRGASGSGGETDA